MKQLCVVKPQWISLLILLSSWLFIQLIAVNFAQPVLNGQYSAYWQSALAVLMTICLPLPKWWLLINGVFPVAIVYTQNLALQPEVFLGLFLVFGLSFGPSLFSRVPYYPSQYSVFKQVAALLPDEANQRFLDLGSGMGGICLQIAKLRPDCRVVGIEKAPFLWLISYIRALLTASSAVFIRSDYTKHDWQDYSLVYAYLSPAVMQSVWKQARGQMRSGSLLVSYEFNIPVDAVQPDQILAIDAYTSLYVWQIP